jgi:hypothetical protein
MARSDQRLGGGPESVAAISRRASSPGPWWRRSRMGRGSFKIPRARAALGMGDQPRRPLGLVAAQPGIHGVGVARPQEPIDGHATGGLAVADLQDGRAWLPDVGAGVVVAELK